MVTALVGISTLITFIQIVMFVVRSGKHQNFYQFMIFFGVLITNIGYFIMSISNSVEAALLSNGLTYIGGVFLPFFVLLTISDLCDIKLSKMVYLILLAASIFVLGLVFTTHYSGLFYKEVFLEKVYGATRMEKIAGPLYFTYRLLLAVDVLVCIYVAIKAYKENKNFTKKSVLAILAITIVPAIIYLIERAFKCPVELLPFCYFIVLGVYLSIASRMSMYDMSQSVASAYEGMDKYGYITFDLKKNLMDSNQMARQIFPELSSTEIDETVEKTDSVFYNEIFKWMDLPDIGEFNEKKITVGDRSIKCTVRKIEKGIRKKTIGYSIELIDNTKQENYIKLLNNYNEELERQVQEKTAHIHKIQRSIITGIASMVESRDNSTGGHIKRTSECVRVFAELISKDDRFPTTEQFLDAVVRSAPMHDLGKIAVDDVILRKPGKFTPEEYAVMKTHSEKGAKIVEEVLKGVEDDYFVQIAINVAHYHHEKWDGTGYPMGIGGIEIPLEARIMALADVFDALVSKRCYKEAFDYDRAFKIIEESLGTHFDPELGKLFIECRPSLEELYNNLPE